MEYSFMKDKEMEIKNLLNKPHVERTLEERVRVCEYAIKELCDYNARNGPAIDAAWMHTPIGGR